MNPLESFTLGPDGTRIGGRMSVNEVAPEGNRLKRVRSLPRRMVIAILSFYFVAPIALLILFA